MAAQPSEDTLRHALSKHFSLDELKLLCHDAGIDPESVPYAERGKEVYAFCIVETFRRKELLPALLSECAKVRPEVNGAEFPIETAVPAEWTAWFSPERLMNTQGGAAVIGDVNTDGGDFVGRDKITITEEQRYLVSDPNPYLGLRAFTYDDRGAYAGRDYEIAEVVKKITAPGEQRILLIVTGASGSGKSSFVQAGVLPALERHYAKTQTHRAVFRPSTKPMAMLDDALLRQMGSSDELTKIADVKLIVIDQLEEVFTQSEPYQQGALLDWLLNLPAFEQAHTHVIVTLRSDYLDDLSQTKLWDVIDKPFALQAMSADELRQAIQRPLQQRYPQDDKQFELALLDKLVVDAKGDAAYLPLLQVTLEELWKKGRLVLANYTGLADAITQRADGVLNYEDYDAPSPSRLRTETARAAITEIFLSLIKVSLDDDERRDVRVGRKKRVLVQSMSQLGDERVNVRELVDDLIGARLLAVTKDSDTENITIIHETLMANWLHLRDSVRDRRERLRQRARFEQQLQEWQKSERSDDYLLSGVHLAQGQQLAHNEDVALHSKEAAEYLQRSNARVQTQQAQQLEETKRREDDQRRTARRLRVIVFTLLFVSLLLIGATTLALISRRTAQQSEQAAVRSQSAALSAQATSDVRRSEAESLEKLARSRELAAIAVNQITDDPDIAIPLAIEANSITQTFESASGLRQVLGETNLYAYFTSTTALSAQDFQFGHSDLAPDGTSILVVGALYSYTDGTWKHPSAVIFDIATRKPRVSLEQLPNTYSQGGFSPDGRAIALVNYEGSWMGIWDPKTGQLVDQISVSQTLAVVNELEWSSRTERIIVRGRMNDSDRRDVVQVWDLQLRKIIATIGDSTSNIKSAHLSPDGSLVLTAHYSPTEGNQYARVWSVNNAELKYEASGVQNAEFSPDGHTFVLATGGLAVNILSTVDFRPIMTLTANWPGVFLARFSPDGRYLAAGGGPIRIWDLTAVAENNAPIRLIGADQWINTIEFSHDNSKLLAFTSNSRHVDIWDISSGERTLRLNHPIGGGRSVSQAKFSRDDRYVMTDADAARLWSISQNEEWMRLDSWSSAFLDNSRIAVNDGKKIMIWDLDTRQAFPQVLTHSLGSSAWPLPANGSTLFVFRYDEGILRWRMAESMSLNKQETQLPLKGLSLATTTVSRDARFIATATLETPRLSLLKPVIRIWNADSFKLIAAIEDTFFDIDYLSFSPDGEYFVIAGATKIDLHYDGSYKFITKTLQVRASKTGHLLFSLDQGDRFLVRFLPDNKHMVLVKPNKLEVLRILGGKRVDEILAGDLEFAVEDISFSQDGTRMAITNINNTASIWDFASKSRRFVLHGHVRGVNQAQISQDGQTVLTSGRDRTARLWDGNTGAEIGVLPLPDSYANTAGGPKFSADGRYVLMQDGGELYVYLAKIDDLLNVARQRSVRALTCEERVRFLREIADCLPKTGTPTPY